MNEEQNTSGTDSKNDGATDPTASGTPTEKYNAVDHAKKNVLSTIGDGEMHDEGLVGAGDTPSIIPSSQDLADEQDSAELRDNQG